MTKLLSYAVLAALAIESPCAAFTAPSSCVSSCRQATSNLALAAVTNDDDNNLNMSRRSFANVIAASSFATVLSSPMVAFAADEDDAKKPSPKRQPLETYLYNILRVREATEQETRIINSKTFKDSQRANVKLAVKFILNNYKLSDSVIAASSYLSGTARVQASGVGQSAVQSLFTIIEYFDSQDVENIKVDALAGKEAIVIKGLESVRRDIDEFLSYFPQDVLDQQKAKVMEENELNFKEFDPELGSILNPNPK
ncbi:hypothetical protein QTG54_001398 [Skeletonema marinoi]|uniref:Uncharacterized protein n=1 Tax=Skeletonema marinoi TaxID=267567 RepID=A0AAD9DIZ9_9STRA|nr:hypothetical protein QTG54_001398 [Skeletonema marinoi]|eukprot:scaffold43882_cov124-Skeletonema_marinoi.AAC.2